MTEPRDAGGSWFSGMSRQAQIVMAVLVVLVVFLGGLLLGSSGDSEPAAIEFTSSPTSSSPAPSTTSAETTTTAAAVASTSPSATTTATPGTTAAPTTTTSPTTTTTTTTTIPIVPVIEDGIFLEEGHGVDLDTGLVYTFPTNPDQVNPMLADAVDAILTEVLLGPTGFNIVVKPHNGALLMSPPSADDSCAQSTGDFGTAKVYTNFTGGVFDAYYCFTTSEGNYALMAVLQATGLQNPIGFAVITVEPPGIPG